MAKKSSSSNYKYSQDALHNQENFEVVNFANGMRLEGDKHRKSRLTFGNLRNTKLSFSNNGFRYGKYSGYYNNIDVIYASQGDVSLDFSQNHRKVEIVTGSGNDFVQIGDGKVSVNMGQGNDVLEVGTIGAESTYNGGAGDDTVVFTNKNANATVTDSSVTIGKKSAKLANFTTFKAESGNAKLNFKKMRQNVTVVTGAGNDTVVLGQGRVNVKLGRGNDTLVLEKAVNRSQVDGGRGTDTLELSAKNVSAVLTDSSVKIGQGLVKLKDFEAVEATNGNITINASSTWRNYAITTGDGDDYVVLGSGQSVVKTGDGNDIITINQIGHGSDINGGSGQDILDLNRVGYSVTISDTELRQGRTRAKLQSIEGVTATRSIDLNLKDITKKFTVTTGKNDDVIRLGTGQVTVNAGNGANMITMLGAGDHKVTTGKGDDEYYLAKGDMKITDAGGDNIFEIVADGNNAAGEIEITLQKAGDNTFNFTHVSVDKDTKQWLEGLQFALVVGAGGSEALEINGLGKATVNISGVENQTEGQINIYRGENLQRRDLAVDFHSVIKALEDGGQTKGLQFTQKGRVWVASVAENGSTKPQVQPVNLSYKADLDLNKATSLQNKVDKEVLTLAQAQANQTTAPVTVKGKLGELVIAQDQTDTSYTYTLNANSRADYDALGNQIAANDELPTESFAFASGQDKAQIDIKLGAALPANADSTIVIGTKGNDTLGFDTYKKAKAIYGGSGNDVITFGEATSGLAYGGLGQDQYNIDSKASATIIEHGTEADTVNIFGAQNLADTAEIENMLNGLNFAITTQGTAITLTITGIENQSSMAFTESSGNFTGDSLNFYTGSYNANLDPNAMLCGVDLNEIVAKLQDKEYASHKLAFKQDTDNPKHYAANFSA